MNFCYSIFLGVLGALGAMSVSADQHAGFADDLSAYEARIVNRSLLLDGVRVGDKMVVVGEHGHILISGDEGKSWRQASVPTRTALTGVTFANDSMGWAVGHDAIILRTTDGGQAWERVYFEPDLQTPLLDVWFADESRGFAVGAYGLFLESSDGGVNWSRRPFLSEPLPREEDEDEDAAEQDDFEDDFVDPEFGEDYHLNHITAAPDGTLYIAAEAGHYYRSDDDGATWLRLEPPYNGSFFGTLPLEGDSLLLFGMRGNLFRSEDRGVSYEPIDTGVESLLTAGYQTDDGTIVVVGLAGTVLESDDGGRSFVQYRQSDRRGYMMALPLDAGGILLIGEEGVVALSQAAYRAGGEQ